MAGVPFPARLRRCSATSSTAQVHRAVDGGRDGGRQADAFVEVGRLAADDDDALDGAAEAASVASTTSGLMRVGVDGRDAASPPTGVGQPASSGSMTATVPGGSPMGTASTSTSAS